jgi:DNA-binding transcriptional LysR family regulator
MPRPPLQFLEASIVEIERSGRDLTRLVNDRTFNVVSLLSHLDVAAVRLFIAVVDAGSISAGAARCNLSTAAASKRISDLEARVDLALLNRHARGISLTPAGQLFLAHAGRISATAEELEVAIRDAAVGVHERVRLVANNTAIEQPLPRELKAFMTRHPHIQVELEEAQSVDVIRLLQTGQADIGIFDWHQPVPGLVVSAYHNDSLVLVAPIGHPLQTRKAVAFVETLDHDYVCLPKGTAARTMMELTASGAGRAMRVRMQVKGFDAICRMAAAGVGLGVVSSSAAADHLRLRRVQAIALEEEWAARTLKVAVPSQRSPTSGTTELLSHLRSCAANTRPDSNGVIVDLSSRRLIRNRVP